MRQPDLNSATGVPGTLALVWGPAVWDQEQGACAPYPWAGYWWV